MEKNRIPAPEAYYVSPLTRCLKTARLTFEGIGLPGTSSFSPVVKEVRLLGLTSSSCVFFPRPLDSNGGGSEATVAY